MVKLKRDTAPSGTYRAALDRARARYRSNPSRPGGSWLRRCPVCGSMRSAMGEWVRRLREMGGNTKHAMAVWRRGATQWLASTAERIATQQSPAIRSLPRRLAQSVARFPELLRSLPESWLERRRTGRQDADYRFRARRYAGSRDRRYRVHVPPNYNGRTPLPVVMVLHGCRQTHADIQRISAFDKVADREGFLVVYPFVTTYSGLRNRNCWGWWLRGEIHAGAGEVEDLWQILREVQATYQVDKHRIHVAGLSSGAGMAVALMVARASKIASGAAVAGVPYGESARAVAFVHHIAGHYRPIRELVREMDAEMGAKKRPVPLFVVHSEDDATVAIQAAHNLRDSWALCFGIDLHKRASSRRGASGATQWEHVKYRGDQRRTFIETLFLAGVGHGWYGGRPGRFSYPEAPPVSEWLWRFFQGHSLNSPLQETVGIEPPSAALPEPEALD